MGSFHFIFSCPSSSFCLLKWICIIFEAHFKVNDHFSIIVLSLFYLIIEILSQIVLPISFVNIVIISSSRCTFLNNMNKLKLKIYTRWFTKRLQLRLLKWINWVYPQNPVWNFTKLSICLLIYECCIFNDIIIKC